MRFGFPARRAIERPRQESNLRTRFGKRVFFRPTMRDRVAARHFARHSRAVNTTRSAPRLGGAASGLAKRKPHDRAAPRASAPGKNRTCARGLGNRCSIY